MASSEERRPAEFKAEGGNCIPFLNTNYYDLPEKCSVAGVKWIDYGSEVFRLIRQLDNIDHDYMKSIYCEETVRKVCVLARPRKVCLLSKDDRFTIKTLHKSELKVLLGILPNYYSHIRNQPSTVLGKVYGVHLVEPAEAMKIYFVVTSNIFQQDIVLHRCYDLKGSMQGRTATKTKIREKLILKDIDLDLKFYIDPFIRLQLLTQINRDCEFLEAVGVINYSLILGVRVTKVHHGLDDGTAYSSVGSSPQRWVSSGSPSVMSTGSCDLKENAPCMLSLSEVFLQTDSHGKFGLELAARAIQVPRAMGETGSQPPNESCLQKPPKVYDVHLYFAIIDIYQDYSVFKRIERCYKWFQFDPRMITAVNPKAYSSRFRDFIAELFKDADELFF